MATNQKSRVEQMAEIQSEGLELFRRKNADYGDAFATYGAIGVLVRMGDKIKRLMSISTKEIQMVDDESMYDTLLDLHNYSAMALMLMREENRKGKGTVSEKEPLEDAQPVNPCEKLVAIEMEPVWHNPIDIYQFLSTRKPFHTNTVMDHSEGFMLLINPPEDVEPFDFVTYNHRIYFNDVYNNSKYDSSNGTYYYHAHIPFTGSDLVDTLSVRVDSVGDDNFTCDVSMFIGPNAYNQDEVDMYCHLLSCFTHLSVRVRFSKKPPKDSILVASGRCYALSSNDRAILARGIVHTKHLRFASGMCQRIEDDVVERKKPSAPKVTRDPYATVPK